MSESAPFDPTKLNWMEDRLILNGLSLRMEHVKSDDQKLGEDSLSFFKVKALIDQYERYWATNPGFRAEKVLELGMFGGGSLLFWFETLHPKKIVGIDYVDTGDSNCFTEYIRKHSLENKVKTYWGVNQADAPTLQKIV